MIDLVLKYGGDLMAMNEGERTPFMVALEHNKIDYLAKFIERIDLA